MTVGLERFLTLIHYKPCYAKIIWETARSLYSDLDSYVYPVNQLITHVIITYEKPEKCKQFSSPFLGEVHDVWCACHNTSHEYWVIISLRTVPGWTCVAISHTFFSCKRRMFHLIVSGITTSENIVCTERFINSHAKLDTFLFKFSNKYHVDLTKTKVRFNHVMHGRVQLTRWIC